MTAFKSFTDAYFELLNLTYKKPECVSAPRGMKIYENLGVQFRLANPRHRLPFLVERGYSAEYLTAESIWYFSGRSDTAWIAKYAPFWNQISDDGINANSAYGSRIFRPHNRVGGMISETWTQWQYIIDELKKDNDSRRCVIHIRTPYDSILAEKDVPCTIALQFFLRNDQLHLHVTMRSSDIILGLPYDVPAFTYFQELMVLELSEALQRPIDLGEYVHTSASLHVYEKHFGLVEAMLNSRMNLQNLKFVSGEHSKGYPGEMERMPSRPPTELLLSYEAKLWNVNTVNQVLQTHVERQSIHPYWDDWLTLLTCKRLSKLGDNEAANRLLDATYYEGWKFFKR